MTLLAHQIGNDICKQAGWDQMDLCEIVFDKEKLHIYNLDLELRKRELTREQTNR